MAATSTTAAQVMHGGISLNASVGPTMGDQLTSRRTGSLSSSSSTAITHSARINIPSPLPNPPFVFPPRDTASSSAPASFSRTTGRRPMSAIELNFEPKRDLGSTMGDKKRQVPPPLPSFSFNPSTSASLGPASALSPPLSPQSPRTMAARPAGHRRSTSEYVGGDGKAGPGVGLVSTSPTKIDGALPSPTGPPAMGPPAGRRGHAHRRSAALSSHDLSIILKPITPTLSPKGGSAPNSPADQVKPQISFPSITNAVGTIPTIQTPQDEEFPRAASSPEGSPPGKALNRVRVGFSDTLEFIPRPLSLVSSDTSSTITTLKGHSVSNSLSSIVSSGTSTPSSKEQRSSASGLLPSQKASDGRPKTAGSILDGTKDTSNFLDGAASPRRRGSIPLLMDDSLNIPGTPSTPKFNAKKWNFFGHDLAGGETSPSRSRPVSAASSVNELQNVKVDIVPPSINVQSPDDMPILEPTVSRRSTASKKHMKKQKKVKSWAGSILSRRTRPRSQKQKAARRSPTPPIHPFASRIEDSTTGSESLAIPVTTTAESSPSTTPEIQTDFTTWKPRKVVPSPDDESMSPIIDLDAALGPFQTPSAFNSSYDPQFEASQKPGSSKRRMHSAAGMGGFVGPGMHYHRRAESAPEMVPFDFPRFGIHRLGSSSTMADVFEEDEEDEWEDTRASDKDSETKVDIEEETGLGIDIKVVEAEDEQSENIMDFSVKEGSASLREVKRKGSAALSEASSRQSNNHGIRSEHSNTSLKDEPIQEELSTQVEIVDDSLLPRPHSRAPSTNSTATPPFRPRIMKEISPMEVQSLSLQSQSLIPSSPFSTTQSSFPSPRSPFSYDTQRVSTTASSFGDENAFQMLLLGEPGPELRMSVDDVPSLSSSRSTMTKESSMNPAAYNPQFREGQRSASFSAAVSRKRSSMASLSRLISSSHGEKSKLSIESRPESFIVEGEKREKPSKSRRISRLMQFWKPKDAP
ncbi:hypothetical protein B7463_g9608, partial [Scytalidium lignicola]